MKSFIAGLGIGALIGLAFAPKSGAETRQELRDAAEERFGEFRDDIKQHAEDLKREYEPRIAALKEEIAGRVESARGHVDSMKEQLDGAAERLVDAKDRIVDQAKQQYGSIVNAGLLAILNEWPEERLIEIHGIGPVLASKIIENRPYKAESDLFESKILPPSAIEALRKAA